MIRYLFHLVFAFFFLSLSFNGYSQTVGLFYNNGSTPGYILFAPINTDTTYLIDKCGKRIHQWGSAYNPGESVHLLEDGSLLHTADANNMMFDAGGRGGILQKIDWDSHVEWSYQISDSNQCQHHDAIELPNGNILTIAWERYTSEDAIEHGRDPSNIGTIMWTDKIVEIKPIGSDSGEIIWQWRIWDHLVQELDPSKLNYGVVADHPELIDINVGTLNLQFVDWTHCNGLDYNAGLDQVLLSCHNFSEVWIIDHSTTMDQAASHSGGNSGRGGDLMYRWGNPQMYHRGGYSDQRFFGQHSPNWIHAGYPDGGKIMVYNNGVNRPGGNYSTVDIFSPPAMVNGNYPLVGEFAYEPVSQDWVYTADPPASMYSSVVSSGQRLQNGNTVIDVGSSATFLEIDPDTNVVWKYKSPVGMNGIVSQGQTPFNSMVFRCIFYDADYPGLAGYTLTPGSPIEINPNNYSCENPIGIENVFSEQENISVYPNPFQNSFFLHVPFPIKNMILQIHDVTGRLLYEEENLSAVNSSDKPINLSDFHGLIFISLKDLSENRMWSTIAIAE